MTRRRYWAQSHASIEFDPIFPAQPHLDLAESGSYRCADATTPLDDGRLTPRGRFARARGSTMTSLPATRNVLHPADAKLLRVSFVYVGPALVVFYVILSGLWLVPDSAVGMYGNHDGHWLSWNTRGILEWGEFFDFSPFSPLVGTGSLFAPYLPWFNPGALALAIPAPLPVRHLASMLIYLAVLSVSLHLLYRHLEFSWERSFV